MISWLAYATEESASEAKTGSARNLGSRSCLARSLGIGLPRRTRRRLLPMKLSPPLNTGSPPVGCWAIPTWHTGPGPPAATGGARARGKEGARNGRGDKEPARKTSRRGQSEERSPAERPTRDEVGSPGL